MARQRTLYRQVSAGFPRDFPQRLDRLRKKLGLSWLRLARRLGARPATVYQWRRGQKPGPAYLLALFELAASIDNGVELLLRPAAREGRADRRRDLALH